MVSTASSQDTGAAPEGGDLSGWTGCEVACFLPGMCDLYSLTRDRAAIRDMTGAHVDRAAGWEPVASILPDDAAPVVRFVDGRRDLLTMRWGMPSTTFALKGRTNDPGVTNIRDTKSPHWRRWLPAENRCLVPFTSFAEHEATGERRKVPVWFAAGEERPLMVFAGLWTRWTSVRKTGREETVDAFGLLSSDANKTVGAVHPKTMPVILSGPEEMDIWLRAPWPEASRLQRPFPEEGLRIVARGKRSDAPKPS